MDKEFKFGLNGILELCEEMSKKLREFGVEDGATIYVGVPQKEFYKVDEDLHYRTKGDKEYIPSEGEIDVTFENIKVIITKKA